MRTAIQGKLVNPGTSYEDAQVYVKRGEEPGVLLDLAKSLRFRSHSPTGFAWGFGGSGPSQLALAILLECVEPGSALHWYQDFKWDFIADLPQIEPFYFEVDVEEWIAGKEKQHAESFA